MKLFSLLNQIFYIALLLLVFFASNIDAQNSEEIEVSISYDGPAEIDESVVDAIGEIRYTFGNPEINFRVSLSRALTADERVKVPLEISGNISSSDITAPTRVGGTGVELLTNDVMLTATVTFQDAGAQFADLKITVRNDTVLEFDERMTIAIADGLSSDQGLSVVKGSSASTVITIRDDEYDINFANNALRVGENDGSIEIPLTIARGRAGNEGLLRPTSMRFRYGGDGSTAGGQDFTEIFSENTIPSFVRLPAGTTTYTLTVPIVNDTEPEDNESFKISIDLPLLPDGSPAREAEITILENDYVYASITAEQEEIDEGDIAKFSVVVTTLSRDADHAIPSKIELRVSDFPGSDFISQDFEGRHMVTLDRLPEFQRTDNEGETYYTTATATFTVDTVNNKLLDRENRIRVEIIPSLDYELAISFATVTVHNDDPQVSIATAPAIYKGNDIVLTMTFNSPIGEDIAIPINITETVGEDFIAADAEGRKEIVFSAGEISKTYRISTSRDETVLDNGNRSVAGRVTVSLVPSSDNPYSIASLASISIDIIDRVCGHAIDADTDDDGLIEICDLEDLDAMRYQLDGSGYRASRTAPLFNAGCDDDGDQGGICRGYELVRSLDFEAPDSYISGSINREWTEGLGWQPIGESLRAFSGYFEANGFAIINLYINRPTDNIALIRNTAPSALINNLILLQIDIRGQSQVGALVADNEGIVSNINLLNGNIAGIGENSGALIGRNKGAVFKNNVIIDTLTGGVTTLRCDSDLTSTNCADTEKSPIVLARGNNVGGLIGNNEGNLSDNFVSIAQVLGGSRVGGLVGTHSGDTFNNNEAGGSVRGNEYAGGLIGESESVGAITNSKSIADVDVTIGGSYAGGLVGYSKSAISDSTVDNIEVSGGIYVGGLIGYGEDTIADSMASDSKVSGVTYVGGLVGYGESTISDSTASDAEVSGETYVGGLVGAAIKTGSRFRIFRSNANGSMTGNIYVGGLIGKAEDVQIVNSMASFSIEAIGDDAQNIGNLVGAIEVGTIRSSNASGKVAGEASKAGGLVGSASDKESGRASDRVRINESYARSDIEGSYEVGGLVGTARGRVQISESYANGDIEGSYEVGGLVGSASGEVQISESYANGNAIGTAHSVGGLVGSASGRVRINKSYALNPSVQGADKVGGLIGIKSGGTVENSYARNSVRGVNRVGGLIGENEYAVSFAYAASTVSASGMDFGGLIGYNHASRSRIVVSNPIENSYWDITASGTHVSDAGIGLDELQTPTAPGAIASEAFYQWRDADWDFGSNIEYPVLKDSEAQILPQQTIALSNLIVEDSLTLVPAFDPNVFDYYIKIDNTRSQISLTLTATDDNAIIPVFHPTTTSSIVGSGTVDIPLNDNPALTEIIIAQRYNIQVIRSLEEITISAAPDLRVNEGQTAGLTVDTNIGSIIPLSYTWKQSRPTTPLLRKRIDTGITVKDPEFSIPIDLDLVPRSATELPITLSVEITGDITGSPKTQSVTLTVIKVSNSIGSVALAAPEFIAGTPALWVPNITETIAGDPDGEAVTAVKNIRYQWQYEQSGARWTNIGNARNASIDLSERDQIGHVRYRQQVSYTDGQGHEDTLISPASMPIVDQDQDGLIELYYLEDLNAIRHNLKGEGYQSNPRANALTNGCPNAACRGYELRRNLNFNYASSYSSRDAHRRLTADFNNRYSRGWPPIEGFSAILDGNGYTISNLQIDRDSMNRIGLFSLTNGAVVRDLNLSNVKIEGKSKVGGLVAEARNSTIIGISVSGEITASTNVAGLIAVTEDNNLIANSQVQVRVKGANLVGALIGSVGTSGNAGDNLIINSHATGTVEGNDSAGGLIAAVLGRARVINSYADVNIINSNNTTDQGGLIGQLNGDNAQIINSYARGSISVFSRGMSSGLIGRLASGTVRNSYSIADLRLSSGNVNGFAAVTPTFDVNNVSDSYWDVIASGQPNSAVGIGKLTTQMQAGIAQSGDPGGVYYNWSEDDWDFGTSRQYPALRYAQHPDLNAEAICDAEGLPKCGAPITPELLYDLRDLSLVGAELSPPFSDGDYTGNGNVTDADADAIRLLPTAHEFDARIDIYNANGNLLEADLLSGTPSQEFTFSAALPTRHFILVVKGTETVRQSIRLNRHVVGMINFIEDLDAIRDDPSINYELTRDLDFATTQSYINVENRAMWTVDYFADDDDTGWDPINAFSGTFDGNHYIIANLQINRTTSVGLFSDTQAGALIHDITLTNVAIEGGENHTGGLTGINRGEIRNSSVVSGTVEGSSRVGGLVGQNDGVIVNSSANGEVTGAGNVGGLVGENRAQVINSNARGLVTATDNDSGGLVGRNTSANARIVNSYASGNVEGMGFAGGLSGSNDGKVINSYAIGNVNGRGRHIIGGLVASLSRDSEIRNSYATGTVSSISSDNSTGEEDIGGLVGVMPNFATVINSYTRGKVTNVTANRSRIGALIGHHSGSNDADRDSNIRDSYWDSTTADQRGSSSDTGRGRTTAQLQMPTSATGIYRNWDSANWDFGTSGQYPILKYAPNPGGEQSCNGTGLPDCGSVISPELRSISNLRNTKLTVIGATINPAFDGSNLDYDGTLSKPGIDAFNEQIQLRVTAPNENDRIAIYIGRDEMQLGNALVSNENSEDITLVPGNNLIMIEIRPASSALFPFRYRLNFMYDGPTFSEIEYLEDLDAIRNNLSGNYQLTRDLDFTDDGSYRDPATNKSTWTTGEGWEPIGFVDDRNNMACNGEADSNCFTGNFNGNGYTISNLYMNRTKGVSDEPPQVFGGLFSAAQGGAIGNLGLVNVDLKMDSILGGVIGYYQNGKLYNSYVTGALEANTAVGGLAGWGRNISIVNSYAKTKIDTLVGSGLIFRVYGNNNKIINSYADVNSINDRTSSSGANGGLMGLAADPAVVDITNSYAIGSIAVSGTGGTAGGLLRSADFGTIRNSYAAVALRSDVSNPTGLKGFIHQIGSGAAVSNSYWDTEVSRQSDDNAVGKTTAELQLPTGATGIYSAWSEDDWAFGTDKQYPILKYTDASETLGFAACGTANTPDCGSVISPEIHSRLMGLTLFGEDSLDPPFDASKHEYIGKVHDNDGNGIIRVIPTAMNTSDTITIHIGDDETQLPGTFMSGDLSLDIELNEDVLVQTILIKVTPENSELTSDYTLYLKLNEIDSLEVLSAIRDNPDNHYHLTRHLDFNDPASYASGAVNEVWTVDNFDNARDTGWVPINNFSGEFFGNGFTISNLQINRNADNQGLFGITTVSGIVRDLGLLNAKIEAGNNAGALLGNNAGTVIGSYAIGKISGRDRVGNLVGNNEGSVFNSYAIGTANNHNGTGGAIGGLVGSSNGTVANSYADVLVVGFSEGAAAGFGGLIGSTLPNSSIDNSYALGRVTVADGTGASYSGGLIGKFAGGKVSNSYASGYLGTEDCTEVSGGGLIGQQIIQPGISVSNNYANGMACTFIARSDESNPDLDPNTGAINAMTHSANYWDLGRSSTTTVVSFDANTNRNIRNIGGSIESKTTAALQTPTTASGIYAAWSEENWDFGTGMEYPILKYAQSTATNVDRVCGSVGLPDCGTVISPQIRGALQNLSLVNDVALSPPFGTEHRNLTGGYFAAVPPAINRIRLIPTADESSAMINIYIGTVIGKGSPDQRIASGRSSEAIDLHDGINRIVLEIVGTQTLQQYPLYIQHYNLSDKDGNGFAEINNLEDLNAIRDNISANNRVLGNYELTRNLAFNDPASYAARRVNEDWMVGDFDDASDTGWMPINFGGIFNGNGYTIANLRINRDADNQGLFGTLAEGSVVRDLSLLNVEIEAGNNIGALAGNNNGTVIGSYATGEIRGGSKVGGLLGVSRGIVINSNARGSVNATGDDIGGLLGRNSDADAIVINSYATGAISGSQWVGGLIGRNEGKIISSHASGTVQGSREIGGLVGSNSNASSEVSNSYATGAVSRDGIGSTDRIGNLLGHAANNAKVINSYAIGTVTDATGNSIGALIGSHAGNIARDVRNSYWNREITGQSRSSGGSSRTTVQLQTPTAPGTTSTNVYLNWNENDWDFGTDEQYPILRYAQNPDRSGVRTCDDTGLSECGTLISPQIRHDLLNVTLAGADELSPVFNTDANEYYGLAITGDSTIRLIPTAKESNLMINIYIGTGRHPDQRVASGESSAPIELDNGINQIVLEIVGTRTARYPLYIQYYDGSDTDGDGFIEISTLEDLNLIRDNPSSNYELTRRLDFNDPTSYRSSVVNQDWISRGGWMPIPNFSGEFNGNGFTIADLQINRNTSNQGLFGTLTAGSIVRDLGLLNVEIAARDNTGALAGTHFGTVIGSYATGEIRGNDRVGGLIGESRSGVIINSRTDILIHASGDDVGGLVGRNLGRMLRSSTVMR